MEMAAASDIHGKVVSKGDSDDMCSLSASTM